MARPTMKEISDAGLTDEVWATVERRNRKPSVRREAARLRKMGRIQPAKAMRPTTIVLSHDGYIKCVGGQTYKVIPEYTSIAN